VAPDVVLDAALDGSARPGSTEVAGARRPRSRAVWLPCLVVTLAWLAVAVSGIRGADYPAHSLRALLWERSGLGVWNTYWYGGHPTPTYSLLSPPVTALLGPMAVAGIGSVVATYAFARLMCELLPGPTTWLANLAFAVGTVVNVVVGRTPFAMGLALCLLALLSWHSGHRDRALVLAVLTPLASPVAASFLAVAAASVAIDRACRRTGGLGMAVAMAGSTTVPVLAMAVLYESPGWFPFRGEQLVFSVVAATFVILVNRHRVVRIGAVLTIAVSIGVFLVPNPLGGNLPRLVQLAAPPLVIAAMPGLRRTSARPLSWLVAAGLVWSVEPGVVAALEWVADESVEADYHEPLIDEVVRRNGDGLPLGRLEIPFTENHWEAFFVAPAVPYARGWERQVDLERNEVLYDDDLSLSEYHGWLHDNAVRWIAVADVALDEGGRRENALIEREGTAHDIPWLRRVWSNGDWRLYEVLDYRPIVDPPAELVHQEVDRFIVAIDEPAVVTIRFEHTDALVVDGSACIEPDQSGAIIAHFPAAGTYEFGIDPGSALRGAASDTCGVPTSDPTAGEVTDRLHHRAESVAYE
jgi:hypothetical protein